MSLSRESERWTDRLFGACLSLLVAALALYGAVWLLRAIWPELVMLAVVGSCLFGLLVWRRQRGGGW